MVLGSGGPGADAALSGNMLLCLLSGNNRTAESERTPAAVMVERADAQEEIFTSSFFLLSNASAATAAEPCWSGTASGHGREGLRGVEGGAGCRALVVLTTKTPLSRPAAMCRTASPRLCGE